MTRQKYSKLEVTSNDRSDILNFLNANLGKIPKCIENILKAVLVREDKFAGSTAELSLKLEMKIVPSSEKCHFDGTGTKPPRKRRSHEEIQEHHRKMANFHRRQERSAARKQKRKEERRRAEDEKRNKKFSPVAEDTRETTMPNSPDLDDSDLDDDIEVESHEFIEAQTRTGKGTDQSEYEASDFSIYGTTADDEMEENSIIIPLTEQERKVLDHSPTSSSFDNRTRMDFVIDCRWAQFQVETATNHATGLRVTASTEDLGPEGTQLTWQTVVNIIISILGYAIPMRRLEKMLGEQFSTVTMVNIIDDFARRFVPVYLCLAESLADSDILSTDDTSTRVNEITRWKRQLSEYEAKIKGSKSEKMQSDPPLKPWEERDRRRKKCWEEKNIKRHKAGLPPLPEPPLSLVEILQRRFGFEFERKKPGKGTKTALHTTVVHGRTDTKEPRSRVVVYRTHFGSAGNFLDNILLDRSPSKKDLIIHGDMSSENNVSNPKLTNLFKITYAGCLAHARRPFFRYRTHDPELTDIMLSGFAIISNVENMIDSEVGRNSTNTTLSRQNLAKPYWESVLRNAKMFLTEWSNLTPLGKGIRYLINNYNNLTVYLSNPKLNPTNNDSENLLRWEALADASSFGCDTLEGRMRSDIIRSALATCAFARVDARKYILFILLADPEFMSEHPEHYTPKAFTRWTSLDSAESLPIADQKYAHTTAHKALRIYSVRFSKKSPG